MRQIITHFTDDDLYTFTCMYYVLKNYPKAQVAYAFFDRNNEKYPAGFDKMLQEQVDYMKNVVITEEEIAFMKSRCYYLPSWFFDFLRGYRYDPSEVHIFQDASGFLTITIEGPWYKTIKWEMMLLATISELSHMLKGEVIEDEKMECDRAFLKALKLESGNCMFADMGTRRRFSFRHQELVVQTLSKSKNFLGTSNVWFAKEFNVTPIGTMSHQIVSAEEVMSGVFEANYNVMKKWQETYNGYLGLYLYDCFGDKVYFNNVDRTSLMMFDGVRVDSGDEVEQFRKHINIYKKFNIDPRSKSICFSNSLNGDKAVEIQKSIDQEMHTTYGIGTWFTCNFDQIEDVPALPFKNKNIVIKLIRFRYSDATDWHDCVKLSCDKGKTLGNQKKCEYLISAINEL